MLYLCVHYTEASHPKSATLKRTEQQKQQKKKEEAGNNQCTSYYSCMCVEKSHGFLLQASLHDLASGCEGDGGTRRHSEGDGGKGVCQGVCQGVAERAGRWQKLPQEQPIFICPLPCDLPG